MAHCDAVRVEPSTPSEENTDELFYRKNTREQFVKAGRQVSGIASRAFDYWCRVMRWKTGFSYIGLAYGQRVEHPYSCNVVSSSDPLKNGVSFRGVIRASPHREITSVDDWAKVQEILTQAEQPPLWMDAFHDAKRRLGEGDLRGAYLETAICLEAFLMELLVSWLESLSETEKARQKPVEKWRMSDILKKPNKISTLNELGLNQKTIDTLKEAVKKRNSIMHGKQVDLDETDLKSILSTVKQIIDAK